MSNQLFIASHVSVDGVALKIGSRSHGRCVRLSDDDALKLAYRLMSLARGGETRGFELFERGENQ